MASIVESIFKDTTGTNLDATLGMNAVNAASASSGAYLTATLEATTPEVRRLFSEYLSQAVIGQEGLVNLALQRGWLRPYESPESQLKMSYQESESVI
jgi:spore coat protein CotF